MAITIREAHCTDSDGIAIVHVESWRTTYRGLMPDDFLDNLAVEPRQRFWSSLLCAPTREQFVYVAVENDPVSNAGVISGKVVGFASGGKERSNDTEYAGEIYALYLLEAYQGRGIGRQLVQHLVADLAHINLHTLLIWVLADNPSRHFYEKLGGQPVRTQLITIGDHSYEETGYGWSDISGLLNSTPT